MIANLLNTLFGIWLVYVAVLDPGWISAGNWKLPLAGVVVLALASAAQASGGRNWQGGVDVVLGILLLILALLRWQGDAPPLLMFWGVFWPGILVAIFSLWAVLYRPARRARAESAAATSAGAS